MVKMEFSLPFMTVLCPSKKHDEQKRLKHKTSIDRTIQLVYVISRLLKCSWILLDDGGFACIKLGDACLNSGTVCSGVSCEWPGIET